MPKMLMVSIAASSALAGAVLVKLAERRTVLAGVPRSAFARVQSTFARISYAISHVRFRTNSNRSSGNASFDAYQAAAIRSLEEESQQFEGFLERLRDAKDKERFRTFLASRRPPVAQDAHSTSSSKGE